MEYNTSKLLWFGYFFIILVALGYGYIGADQMQKNSIMFYAGLMAFVLGLVVVFFDWATTREFSEIDTITIEESHSGLEWLDLRAQLLIGAVLALFVFWKISVTGNAFVDAPVWGIFDSTLGNAIFSAIIGPIENLTFFGVIMPTTIAMAELRLDNRMLAVLVGFLVATGAFTGYHMWRYGADEAAMLSVIVFGLVGSVVTYASNSLLIIDIVHATNNLAVGLGLAKQIALAIIL